MVRAGVDDREMVNATGINVDRLFVLVSALASFLAGMAGVVGGAFLTLNPGAEWDILVLALVVVIIGGLGSLEGAILGSIIVGLLDAYGRWLLPEFSYFVLFGPMAILLLFRVDRNLRQGALSDAPCRCRRSSVSPSPPCMPLVAGEFWITLLTQIMIFGLLALSADLLLGHAGLFSLCHASFFAVAAYTTAILQVRHGAPTALAAPAGILAGTLLALVFAVRGAHARRLLHPDHARVRLHRLGRRLSLGLVHRRRQRRHQRAVPGDRRAARHQRHPVLLPRARRRGAVRARLPHPDDLAVRPRRCAASSRASRACAASATMSAGISMWRSCCPGMIASIAGVLYVYYNRFINPVAASFPVSVEAVLMAIVGGTGTILGPFIGSGIILMLRNWVSGFFHYYHGGARRRVHRHGAVGAARASWAWSARWRAGDRGEGA